MDEKLKSRKRARDAGKFSAAIAAANKHLSNGHIAAACAEFARARAIRPDHAELRLLEANIHLATGRIEDAQRCVDSLMRDFADSAQVLILAGRIALRAGQHERASEHFERHVMRAPHDRDAWISLGLARRSAGKLDAAVAAYQRALALDPCLLAAWINLGNLYREQGNIARAIECYRRSCSICPDEAVAHYHLGVALRDLNDDENARASFERAIGLQPGYVEARFNLANVLCDLGEIDAALEHIHAALHARPDDAALRLRCGALLAANDRAAQALPILGRAGELAPNDAAVFNNVGLAMVQAGKIDDALAAYDRALAMEPVGSARINRALAYLLIERYPEGWADYEARWSGGELLAPLDRTLSVPRWEATSLEGKTLLVLGEQGLGDEIMFASLLHEVIERARRVVVQCSTKLERLFARSFPDACIIGLDRDGAEWPQRLAARLRDIDRVDAYAPIGSLARVFRSDVTTFPSRASYLRADPVRVTYWRARLASIHHGKWFGISWRGGTVGTGRNRRSMALAALAPLLRTSGARFVSLQYTDCADEIATLGRATGLRIEHWPDVIDDYDETAALVCALDRVFSVCTSAVHLCGALGVPVSVMAPKVPEWRYGLVQERMRWYSCVTVLRQSNAGEWRDVIAKLAGLDPLDVPSVAARYAPRVVDPIVAANHLLAAGKAAAACDVLHAAFENNPRDLSIVTNLATALMESGRADGAIVVLAAAVETHPQAVHLIMNLACASHEQGRFHEALNALDRAIMLAPDIAALHYNRSAPLAALEKLTDAEQSCRCALALDPTLADAHNNLAHVLYRMRRVPEALEAIVHAIVLDPVNPSYRVTQAHAQLLGGDWPLGWETYEWRLAEKTASVPRPAVGVPRWRGEPIAGRSILLYAEQGFGDAIQFCRYAPWVAECGARVVLCTYRELRRLFSSLDNRIEFIDEHQSRPACDFICSLMSLPAIFRTSIDDIPREFPYLHVGAVLYERWRARFEAIRGLRVGLVWAGSPRQSSPESTLVDARRSMAREVLVEAISLAGITLVSLQKGKVGMPCSDVVDCTAEIGDFADTAALIMQLDLVISVDTAVAHLAGALGKPVWMLSRHDGCWRWLLDGGTTLWYPSMRIYRQPAPGDWTSVLAEVRRDLRTLLSERG